MTQENAWQNNFIEDFNNLTLSRTADLQLLTQFLEMATKIYSVRVNSLFIDVTRTNQTLKVNLINESKPTEKTQCQKKIKTRKLIQNTASLDRPVDLISFPNLCLSKVLNIAGNRSENMLTYNLRSKNGSFLIPGFNTKFWDSNDYQQRSSDEGLVGLKGVSFQPSNIRSSLEFYKIAKEPLEKHFPVQ